MVKMSCDKCHDMDCTDGYVSTTVCRDCFDKHNDTVKRTKEVFNVLQSKIDDMQTSLDLILANEDDVITLKTFGDED